MIKQKRCKSHGKASGFQSCGELVPAQTRKYGLCRMCFATWVYSTGEGSEYINKMVIPKAKKMVETEDKERMKAMKLKVTNWKAKLQTEVNKIARLIDYGLPCLARQNFPNQMHAGHIMSRGGHANMKYNLHNIHRQSAQSNTYHSDDTLLRKRLSEEYGKTYLDYVEALQKTPQFKYSNEEYHDFTTKAREIVRRLEKENEALEWTHRPTKERIELRDSINSELAIYPDEYCKFNKP